MIELPEAKVLADQLNQSIKGKRIAQVIAAKSKHGFAFYNRDPADYAELLQGKRIEGCQAYGGRVELGLGDVLISFNDGVNARYLRPGQTRPAKHQLLIEFDDGSAICCTVQMYGGMTVYRTGEDMGFYGEVAKRKPSPLTDAFDRAYFDTLFDGIKPSLSVKALLATEQRIPGLGNGVLQDILWKAGIHPKAKAAQLTLDQRSVLFESVKSTLKDMAAQGGRDTEKDLFGAQGGYPSVLSAKTLNIPCPRCLGAITRQAYLGGNVYFCAHCQKA